MVCLAVLLGFSPLDRLQWASHVLIAHLLAFVLMLAWLAGNAATAVLYWRDRHGAAE